MLKVKLNHLYTIWGSILLIWTLYRFYLHLPEAADELLFKPAIFLGPVLVYVWVKERQPLVSIGVTLANFNRDLLLGLGGGVLFTLLGVIVNIAKYGRIILLPKMLISWPSLLVLLILSLISSFSEETLIRGFFYTRLKQAYKSTFKALVISATMYLILVIPMLFMLNLSGTSLLLFVYTNILLSVNNTIIFDQTHTLTLPVLLHAFWNLTVLLYL